jgi:hypothetical protein
MTAFFKKLGTTDIRNILAVLYVTMVLTYIYVLVFKSVPIENKDLVNIIGGNVIGGLGVVLGYYFGASKKDTPKEKDME